MASPDDEARPAWPGAPTPSSEPQAPAPHHPTFPSPPAEPVSTPAAEPVRPSWAKRPSWAALDVNQDGSVGLFDIGRFVKREVDLKFVIAVMIGVVSVTGAFMTWRSSILGEKATDKDRQALAETVQVQQDDAANEVSVQDELVRFSQFAADQRNADLLEEQAGQTGDPDEARRLRDEAEELRREADLLAQVTTSPLGFLDYTTTDETGSLTFDEEALRDDLTEGSARESQIDPDQTTADAVDLRNRSQRMVGFIISLVAAVVLLTFAQLIGERTIRLAFLGTASAVWIISTVLAFGTS